MRAQLLKKPRLIADNPLEPADIPIPEPAAGELRLAVRVCGICHTDLHICEGELKGGRLPVVPGHQVMGIVDKAGAGTSRFKVGDRVGVAWLHRACGKCAFCARGNENLCEGAQFTGFNVNGGYAEYIVVPEDFAYSVPAAFSDRDAAPLLCAGIIGFRALRLCEIRPGGRLALYGFGASAHICIQIARHWGCEVFVHTRNEAHCALARDLGAAWVGGADDSAPAKADSAIIFAPAGDLVHNALRGLQKGGTLALAGIYMSPIPPINYGELLYHEKTIRSVTNSTRQDGHDFLKVAAEIPVRTKTTLFPLEDANRALHLLKAGQIRGAGVLQI